MIVCPPESNERMNCLDSRSEQAPPGTIMASSDELSQPALWTLPELLFLKCLYSVEIS
jgi:hypothetical protein